TELPPRHLMTDSANYFDIVFERRLRRPFWCAARIGDDEQDVVNLLVPEEVLGCLVGQQRQFPLADGRFVARNRQPIAAICSACADDAIDRVSGTTDWSLIPLILEQELGARYLDSFPISWGQVKHQMLNLQIDNVWQEVLECGLEAHNHRCRRLVWIIQVVPLIRELLLETERPVEAELRIECLDHLLPVV